MRTFFIGVVLIGVSAVLLVLRKPFSTTTPTIHSPSPSPPVAQSPILPAQSVDVTRDGKSYRITWLLIPDPSALTLIPNFAQKRTARSFVDSKECSEVINGGFYTTDGRPTGFFTSEGETIRDAAPNALLNGYIVVNHDNNASIRASPPEGFVRIGLQAGPILVREGNAVTLAIRDDEFARRVFAATTQKGEVVFLVIYDPENPWSGPKLADTPAIVSRVAALLQLTDALNLDGGSASAFIRSDFSLEELTSVGSFFCMK